jgi:unsaturated chondroitin disaccharide hydrolase
MKSFLFLSLLCLVTFGIKGQSLNKKIARQLKYSLSEVAKAKVRNPKVVSPRSMRDDTLFMVPSKDWTSGFYAGNLWYTYELTNDEFWKQKAIEFTAPIENEKNDKTTHDLGFKLYCSFGNGYRLSSNPAYKEILLQSARTLCTRYNPIVGSMRSWDHSTDKWAFPVIIDNMMNLDLLFWAFKQTQDSLFYNVAINHANTTMKNHFREDYSSYHVIDYDAKTGKVTKKNTHQGYSHESAWARGQAWALYGFSMCYRETGNKAYLKQAEKIAEFLLNHPNLPKDLIPYWDFNAPNIPNAPRDVSAATIMASALYEMSIQVSEKNKYYREIADRIMDNVKNNYMCKPKTNGGFLLNNSTGHLPGNHEINVPIVYADYYYLEALLRKRILDKIKN